ncbi:Methyltransferase type 11 - like 7 [Theobroma cacao]|nr:Methyltransferase type 11 - like 7 [Theobroma cacao]
MKMPFPDSSFDAVYAIEATCHAPDAYGCYKEIYRVLKPGQYFAAYEWCMTDSFDPNNQEHQKIKAEIEIGDGLPDIRLTRQCLEALKQAGFEVIWDKDLAVDSSIPWYLPLDKNHFSLSSFRLTAIGRFVTKNMADFMKMPFPDSSFDAVYAIEATCHAPDAYGCYKEIYRVLKPGQYFAAYEWCMTDSFDPNNQEHQKIKAEIEIGDGLPDIRLTRQCLEALKQAGFEVIWDKDLAVDSSIPWYLPLDKNHFSLSSFRLTAIGRFVTKNMMQSPFSVAN